MEARCTLLQVGDFLPGMTSRSMRGCGQDKRQWLNGMLVVVLPCPLVRLQSHVEESGIQLYKEQSRLTCRTLHRSSMEWNTRMCVCVCVHSDTTMEPACAVRCAAAWAIVVMSLVQGNNNSETTTVKTILGTTIIASARNWPEYRTTHYSNASFW